METVQIYKILNDVVAQAMGDIGIKVVDTGSFISLGNAILNQGNNVEPVLNTLIQRIGKIVLSRRAYTSPFASLIKGDIEWGAIVQKIGVRMPKVSEEEAIPLVDGESVDQWKISLPDAYQKMFIQRSPYKIWITIPRLWLNEAFTSEREMDKFISMVFMAVRDKLELCIEGLARMALANYAAITPDSQTINLVTMYNAQSGNSITPGVSALFDRDFLAWTSGIIREIGRDMTNMSTMYNIDGEEKHTPVRDQRLTLLSKFRTQLDTVLFANTFHNDYLSVVPNMTVPFWQAPNPAGSDGNVDLSLLDFSTRSTINVTTRTISGNSENVTLNNVVGMLYDRDALGAYRQHQLTLTTHVNASGAYSNTFWHEQQLWFNATDENFILFTLN